MTALKGIYLLFILSILNYLVATQTELTRFKKKRHLKKDITFFEGDYFDGDMVLNPAQQQLIFESVDKKDKRSKRYIKKIHSEYIWPDKIVYYYIEAGFTQAQYKLIMNAIGLINDLTCIEFQPAVAGTPYYVGIRLGQYTCSSEVGCQKRKQLIVIREDDVGDGCVTLGGILHLLLHTLGFYHQQNVPNRDQYVNIRYDNIATGKEKNFRRLPFGGVSQWGVPYDFESVMHSSTFIFSQNRLQTIEPIEDVEVKIGRYLNLSQGDIIKINRMYNCEAILK